MGEFLRKTKGIFFSIFGAYVISSLVGGNLNPLKWDGRFKYNEVHSKYSDLFKDAETFDDSLEVYKKYGLPIKLQNPSFEQKEAIIKKIEEIQ